MKRELKKHMTICLKNNIKLNFIYIFVSLYIHIHNNVKGHI